MTTPTPKNPLAGLRNPLTCVICLRRFSWAGDVVYRHTPAGPDEVPLSKWTPESDQEWRIKVHDTFVRCPNKITDDPHDFPLEFAISEEDPVVIGFVGDSDTGKTCLLAAVLGLIERDGLSDFGLHRELVSLSDHATYMKEKVAPFFNEGKAPEHTAVLDLVPIADAVLLRSSRSGRRFPVVFFDASGEVLAGERGSPLATRFFQRVDGLIFVADPVKLGTAKARFGDPTYNTVMTRLRAEQRLPDGRIAIPAAVAVTKSDLHRFEPPVDQWLNRPTPEGGLDPALLEAESRDAYAFLFAREGAPWLTPVENFVTCSVHFVSASGCSTTVEGEKPTRFIRPARPRRVLEPLVAVLDAIEAA